MDTEQVIQSPLITEKGTYIREKTGQYVFQVHKAASKFQIKKAIEGLFKVEVAQIRTLNIRGKLKRVGRSIGKRPNWKKAYVTLKPGSTIQVFEGV